VRIVGGGNGVGSSERLKQWEQLFSLDTEHCSSMCRACYWSVMLPLSCVKLVLSNILLHAEGHKIGTFKTKAANRQPTIVSQLSQGAAKVTTYRRFANEVKFHSM
jgi:hypothetical protein